MNTQVVLTSIAVGLIVGKDADGNVRALGSLNLSIDDYTTAYVAGAPSQGIGGYMVVPKNPLQVGTKTVNITATGTDASGNALPPQTLAFDIVGAPPAPLATELTIQVLAVGGYAKSPDPGSNTVNLI